MLEELQKRLNDIRDYRENGFDEFADDLMVEFNTCRRFCEAVTGKKLTVKNWTVTEA